MSYLLLLCGAVCKVMDDSLCAILSHCIFFSLIVTAYIAGKPFLRDLRQTFKFQRAEPFMTQREQLPTGRSLLPCSLRI